MAGEWQNCALGDVIELKRGYDLPQKVRLPGSIPLVSSSGITDSHAESMVKGPGVVTGRYGTLGQIFYIKQDFWPLNTTLYVRDFKGNDPRFINYFLQSVDFLVYSDKAAVPGLNRNHLHQARVRFPTKIEDQRRIAHILGTLDDKIENNRKTAKTLEAMAQTIFKSWFVDFDPVRAKMAGESRESICKRLKLTPEILDLFPDRLVDSELGEIPERWVLNPISEIIEFNPAMPIKKNVAAPYLDMASLPTAGCWPADPVFRPYSSGVRFQNGDTLLARITPCLENGKTAYIQCLKDHGVGWGSTEFIVMRPKPPVPSVVAYLIARNDKFRAHAIQGMTGTSGRQRVQVTTVSDFQVIQPDNASIWPYFGSISVPLFDNIKSFSKENLPLIKLRDTLLPKLISGEIRVPEAEHLIEEASG